MSLFIHHNEKIQVTLSGTELKCRAWRLHASVLCGAMVFIEATLTMDCRIKMSLLSLKSPLGRAGSSCLSGLVAVKPHVPTFNQRLQPSHTYTTLCWLKKRRSKGPFFSPCKNRWSTCRIITSLVRICLFSNTWASLCDLLDFLLQILYNGPAWKENKGHLGIYCNIVSNCGRLICLEDRQQRGSIVILVIRIDWEFAAHYAASVALISSHGNKICLILHKTFHMLDPMQGGFYYKS